MIYLKYKLEKANIKDLKRVYVSKIDNGWFFLQISSEIQILFPDAVVKEVDSELRAISSCDLIVFPCKGSIYYRLKYIFPSLRKYISLPAKNVMFYAINDRVIDIVEKRQLLKWFMRKTVELICIFCMWWLRKLYNFGYQIGKGK